MLKALPHHEDPQCQTTEMEDNHRHHRDAVFQKNPPEGNIWEFIMESKMNWISFCKQQSKNSLTKFHEVV